MKEEDRLAAVVASIDHEVAVVPHGAYIKTPLGGIRKNRSFEGTNMSTIIDGGSWKPKHHCLAKSSFSKDNRPTYYLFYHLCICNFVMDITNCYIFSNRSQQDNIVLSISHKSVY